MWGLTEAKHRSITCASSRTIMFKQIEGFIRVSSYSVFFKWPIIIKNGLLARFHGVAPQWAATRTA
jgi:hypothetical protein